MTKEALMLFIERLLRTGSEEKATNNLLQLQQILTDQGADKEWIDLVRQTHTCIRETMELGKTKECISEEELRAAIQRGILRIKWEKANQSYGRC